MPLVRIELFSGRTREQKANAAFEITEVLRKTMDVPPESTQIIFVEFEKSDWAKAGKLFDSR
jgi:4-oxalocrotonate tautomerase